MNAVLAPDRPKLQFADRRFELDGPDADPVRKMLSAALKPFTRILPKQVKRHRVIPGSWFSGDRTVLEQVTVPWTKADLFGQYDGQVTALAQASGQLRSLLAAVATGAGLPRQFPPKGRPEEPITDYHLAEEGIETIRQTLEESLVRKAAALAAWFAHQLQAGVTDATPTVGLIEFSRKDPTVCHYGFPRYSAVESAYDVPGATAFTRTRYAEFHLHDLIEIVRHAYPFRSVKAPPRVRSVAEAVPDFLQPHVFAITGQQIRELVLRKEIGRDTWWEPKPVRRFRPDPALVLGPYVLAGWSEDEK
jgi:hypothetical protein